MLFKLTLDCVLFFLGGGVPYKNYICSPIFMNNIVLANNGLHSCSDKHEAMSAK